MRYIISNMGFVLSGRVGRINIHVLKAVHADLFEAIHVGKSGHHIREAVLPPNPTREVVCPSA